jgi:hypothetical protein
MPTTWNQAELQRHINDGVEESLNLDYKAAGSLGTNNDKKTEITKDVSAIANSAGGVIIYGIKEYDQTDKKHLPEKLTPIDRTQFSKEWLEQIINSIQPRITGIVIHPVDLNTGTNDVAYVVEIPQSTTAHQARDKRYYKRFNSLCEAMEHYEIQDVMNRATLPDVDVEFSYDNTNFTVFNPEYHLDVLIVNRGVKVVQKYRLLFTFPIFGNQVTLINGYDRNDPFYEFYGAQKNSDGSEYIIIFRSRDVLFPEDAIGIGNIIELKYKIDTKLHHELMKKKIAGNETKVRWVLYADDMPRKIGEIPFSTLYDSDK